MVWYTPQMRTHWCEQAHIKTWLDTGDDMNGSERLLELKKQAASAWKRLGRGRGWIAGGCAGLVVVLALGIWSCQWTPAPKRPPLPGSVASLGAGEPEVRVRIRQGVQTARIDGPAQFRLRPVGAAGVERNLPGPLTATVLVDGIRITDGRGAHWSYEAPVEIVAAERSPGSGTATPVVPLIKVDDVRYGGRIHIVPRAGVPVRSASAESGGGEGRPARLDVIEVVPMEMYIAGVTVSELWGHWALGAFQTQSVAARTYAMQQRDRAQRLGRDYDLEATVLDQAYNGWTSHANAVQAAAETRGVVLTWQGRLIRAYYSSTCGGRTAGAAEVWPTGPGFEFNLDAPIQAYEREHACEISKFNTWEVVRERSELSRRLREWGKANGNGIRRIGQVQTVVALERNSTGRPVRYVITDDQRMRFELGAEHLRNACNFNVAGLPEIKGVAPLRVLSGDLEMEFKGNQITIRGRGFGHGVGMCQYCAQGMAQRGDHWRVMLQRFYPGARLERVY